MPTLKCGTLKKFQEACCRCDACKLAAKTSLEARREKQVKSSEPYREAKKAIIKHGSFYTYKFKNCRCDPCTEAFINSNYRKKPPLVRM